MERVERFKKAYEYVRFKGLAKTQEDVAKKMRRQRTNVSSALNGSERYLTDAFLSDFCLTFNIFSLDWLLTGEGSMLKDGEPSAESPNENQLLKERIQGLEALLAEKERLIKVYEKMMER